jgi:hypothetical protein
MATFADGLLRAHQAGVLPADDRSFYAAALKTFGGSHTNTADPF